MDMHFKLHSAACHGSIKLAKSINSITSSPWNSKMLDRETTIGEKGKDKAKKIR